MPNSRDFIRDYPDDNLECRYPAHSWAMPFVARETYDGRRVVVVQFSCRCGANRVDVLDRNGERISSHINYPPGYVVKGRGRIDRARFRAERVRRLEAGK